MKKIAIVVNEFPAYSETFIVEHIIGLIKSGFKVSIFATKKTEKQCIEKRIKNVEVLFYPDFFPSHCLLAPSETISCFFSSIKRFGFTKKAFKKFFLQLAFVGRKFDIIHFEFGTIAKELICLSYFKKTKFTSSFRGYDLLFAKKEEYKEVFERLQKAHFISKFLLEEAKKIGFVGKFEIINPAADTEFFCPVQKKTKSNIVKIVGVGRISWKKGYVYALKAISELTKKGYAIKYSIIGTFADKKEIDTKGMLLYTIEELKISNVVELCGTLDKEELKKKLNESDIFLHTAVSEGFGNAPLEAMAMELPIVSFDSGGLKESIINKKTGFLVPVRETKKLTEKLEYLIKNKKERIQLGKNGRALVKKKFNIEKQRTEFNAFYSELIKAK